MITASQAEKIKKTIGTNYANKVAEFLKARKIVSRNGKPYKAQYVRDILNLDNRENTDIEEGIWMLVESIIEKAEKRNAMLDQHLENDNLINEEE